MESQEFVSLSLSLALAAKTKGYISVPPSRFETAFGRLVGRPKVLGGK